MGNVLISEHPQERLHGFLHDFDYSSMTKSIPGIDDCASQDPLMRVAEEYNEATKERTVRRYTYRHHPIADRLFRARSTTSHTHCCATRKLFTLSTTTSNPSTGSSYGLSFGLHRTNSNTSKIPARISSTSVTTNERPRTKWVGS